MARGYVKRQGKIETHVASPANFHPLPGGTRGSLSARERGNGSWQRSGPALVENRIPRPFDYPTYTTTRCHAFPGGARALAGVNTREGDGIVVLMERIACSSVSRRGKRRFDGSKLKFDCLLATVFAAERDKETTTCRPVVC